MLALNLFLTLLVESVLNRVNSIVLCINVVWSYEERYILSKKQNDQTTEHGNFSKGF